MARMDDAFSDVSVRTDDEVLPNDTIGKQRSNGNTGFDWENMGLNGIRNLKILVILSPRKMRNRGLRA